MFRFLLEKRKRAKKTSASGPKGRWKETMQIIVNGKSLDVREGMNIKDLLVELGVQTRGTAVEVNRTIVPKTTHAERLLEEGDRVEIIRMVGGG